MADPLVTTGIQLAWHSIKRTFSVIATLLVIAGLGWLVYVGMIRPHTKGTFRTKQEGQGDNYAVTIEPRSYFGCQNFRIARPDAKPNLQTGNTEKLPAVDKAGNKP